MKKLSTLAAFASFVFAAFGAYAEPAARDSGQAAGYEGIALPYQLGFQPPATPVMERLYDLHSFLLVVITAITVVVLVLMAYICLRFSRKANPVPSTTTHNTRLEIIWTTIPILILVAIAIPSLKLHYYMQRTVDTALTVKAVGYQWYWHYDYPADNPGNAGGFSFDSYMIKDADLKPADYRNLSVDNRMVVPVDTRIRVQVTGGDVIHSWAMPAFGVKKDAIPGRLNETWFEATRIGTYYGQCSQLCGVGHGFMPVVVEVVSKEDFAAWVQKKRQEAGLGGEAPARAEQGKAVKKSDAKDSAADKNARPAAAAAPKKAARPAQAEAENGDEAEQATETNNE